MNKQRGFTLIELLIVLAILAILIGIVAMSIGNLRQTAMERGMQAERETVETAINSYVTLDDDNPAPVGEAATIATTQDFGKYLKKASKYFYSWGFAGRPTQNVVVWNMAFDDADFCAVANTIGADVVACNASACFQGDAAIKGANLHLVGRDANEDGDLTDAGEAWACP